MDIGTPIQQSHAYNDDANVNISVKAGCPAFQALFSGILGTFYFYDGFKLNNSCKIHFHAGVVGNSYAMLVSIFTTS